MKDGKRVSVFSLREDTLPDLDATSVVVEEDRLASDDRLIDAEGREVEEADRFGSLTVGTAKCSTCGVEFEDHVEQREHFRSDWHRYNLSRREKKLSALTEEEFERLSDSVSISGSEDEADHSEDEMIALRSVRQSPMVEYPTPSGEYVSAWKAAIPTNGTLKDLKEVKKVCLFLAGGGHFAGVVFGPKGLVGKPEINPKGNREKDGDIQKRLSHPIHPICLAPFVIWVTLPH